MPSRQGNIRCAYDSFDPPQRQTANGSKLDRVMPDCCDPVGSRWKIACEVPAVASIAPVGNERKNSHRAVGKGRGTDGNCNTRYFSIRQEDLIGQFPF